MVKLPADLAEFPELVDLAPAMDHLDRRKAVTTGGLRQVAAAMLSYRPLWLRAGMGLRNAVAGSLGIGLGEPMLHANVTVETLPVTPGEVAGPFTVQAFREEALWLGLAEDEQLQAYNALVMDAPRADGRKTVQAVTLCRFKTGKGRLYLNAILPVHTLVIDRALWHGCLQASKAPAEQATAGALTARRVSVCSAFPQSIHPFRIDIHEHPFRASGFQRPCPFSSLRHRRGPS